MSAFARFVCADARMLLRSGYIWANLVVFGLMLLVAFQASHLDFAGYQNFIAAIALFNVVLTPVMLVGLMVLVERGEGSATVLCVCPAPLSVYMAARTTIVVGISLAEVLVLVAAVYDAAFSPIVLTVGLGLAAGMAALAGFILTAFFEDIYAFILPMIVTVLVLGAPGYAVLLNADPAVLVWHPTAGALALIEAGFTPGARFHSLALASAVVWCPIAIMLAYKAMRRLQMRLGGA